jgi:hypothetical protein
MVESSGVSDCAAFIISTLTMLSLRTLVLLRLLFPFFPDAQCTHRLGAIQILIKALYQSLARQATVRGQVAELLASNRNACDAGL